MALLSTCDFFPLVESETLILLSVIPKLYAPKEHPVLLLNSSYKALHE